VRFHERSRGVHLSPALELALERAARVLALRRRLGRRGVLDRAEAFELGAFASQGRSIRANVGVELKGVRWR